MAKMKNNITEKPWGYEELIVHTSLYVLKKIVINAGHRLSKQYHEKKDETVYVQKGVLTLEADYSDRSRDIFSLEEGECYRIEPGIVHRFSATNEDSVELFEVSTPEIYDVIRLEDDYGRIE